MMYIKGFLRAPKPLVNLFRNNAYLRAEYTRAGREFGVEMPPLDLEGDDDPQSLQEGSDETAGESEEERAEVDDEDEGDSEELVSSEEMGSSSERDGDEGAGERSVTRGPVTDRDDRRQDTAEGISDDDEEDDDDESDYDEDDTEEEGDNGGDWAQGDGNGSVVEPSTREGPDDVDEGVRGREGASVDSHRGLGRAGVDRTEGEGDGEDEFFEDDDDLKDLVELDVEMENILDEFEDELVGDDERAPLYDGDEDDDDDYTDSSLDD